VGSFTLAVDLFLFLDKFLRDNFLLGLSLFYLLIHLLLTIGHEHLAHLLLLFLEITLDLVVLGHAIRLSQNLLLDSLDLLG